MESFYFWLDGPIARLIFSCVLCALVGLEREYRQKSAGFHTHLFVGMGSTAFTLISIYGFGAADPSRVAAQIVSGIGFIGAGAIMRQGLSVRGLTTASTLWLVSSIGMAVGVGWYEEALAVTGVALIALIMLANVERHLPTAKSAVTVQLRLTVGLGAQDAIKELLAQGEWIVRRGHMEKTEGEFMQLSYLIRRHRGNMADVEDLAKALGAIASIRQLGWEVLEVAT